MSHPLASPHCNRCHGSGEAQHRGFRTTCDCVVRGLEVAVERLTREREEAKDEAAAMRSHRNTLIAHVGELRQIAAAYGINEPEALDLLATDHVEAMARARADVVEARRERGEALEQRDHLETIVRRRETSDALHPSGRCVCTGEGWCLFCRWTDESEKRVAAEALVRRLGECAAAAQITLGDMLTSLRASAIAQETAVSRQLWDLGSARSFLTDLVLSAGKVAPSVDAEPGEMDPAEEPAQDVREHDQKDDDANPFLEDGIGHDGTKDREHEARDHEKNE